MSASERAVRTKARSERRKRGANESEERSEVLSLSRCLVAPHCSLSDEFFLIYLFLANFLLTTHRPGIKGKLAVVMALLVRVAVKIITDFSGCLHFRHPYEMGGLAFCLSMLWAQIFPFIALDMFETNDDPEIIKLKEAITTFLIGE